MNILTDASCVTPGSPKKFPGTVICSYGQGPAVTFCAWSDLIRVDDACIAAGSDPVRVPIRIPRTSAWPAIAVTACTVQCACWRDSKINRLILVISGVSPKIATSIIVPAEGVSAATRRRCWFGVNVRSASLASSCNRANRSCSATRLASAAARLASAILASAVATFATASFDAALARATCASASDARAFASDARALASARWDSAFSARSLALPARRLVSAADLFSSAIRASDRRSFKIPRSDWAVLSFLVKSSALNWEYSAAEAIITAKLVTRRYPAFQRFADLCSSAILEFRAWTLRLSEVEIGRFSAVPPALIFVIIAMYRAARAKRL
jgi:hypothetical protein